MKSFAFLALAPVAQCWQNHPPSDLTFGVDGALHLSFGSVFYALNTDGSTKWTFNTWPTGTTTPIVAHKEDSNGTIHVITQPSVTAARMHYAIDGVDGSLRWMETAQDKGPCYMDKVQLLIGDSTVYTICEGPTHEPAYAHTYIRIEANGEWPRRWVKEIANITQIDVSPDGGVLVQTAARYPDPHSLGFLHNSSLFVLHPEDGGLAWTLDMEGLVGGTQWALSAGDIFVAPIPHEATTLSVNLLHLHGDNGDLLWNASYNLPDLGMHYGSRTIPSVKPIPGCNGEVYVTSLKDEDGICRTHAVDFKGSTLRTLPCFENEFTFQHSTLQNDDGAEEDIFVTRAYDFAAHQTNVVMYSGTTGHLLWNASIVGDFNLHKIGPDGTVLVCDQHYHHETIAIRNGYEAWRKPSIIAAPLMAKDGTIYLLRQNPDPFIAGGEVVALDANGTQKWSYHLPDGSAQNAQSSIAVV